MKAKLSILVALIGILLAMLACENADPISGTADYTGTGEVHAGYSCPHGQYLSSDDAGHQICRLASR